MLKGVGAMKRRRWDSKTKTKIVLEGLSGVDDTQITSPSTVTAPPIS